MAIIAGYEFNLDTFEVFRRWIEDLGKPEVDAKGRRIFNGKVIGFELSAGVEGVVSIACDVRIDVKGALDGVDVAKELFDSTLQPELYDFKVKYVYDDKDKAIKDTITVHMEGFLDDGKSIESEEELSEASD